MRTRPTLHPIRRPVMTGALLLAVALSSAGCGGSDASSSPPAEPTTETSAPENARTTAAKPDDCSVAIPEMTAATSMLGTVTDITVDGCDLATVTTSLTATADDAMGAAGVCSYAANEAAGHGVAATVVVAADGTELARGTSAQDCASTFTA